MDLNHSTIHNNTADFNLFCSGVHILADTDFPVINKLYIYGTLELEDIRDFNITATYIVIQGGRLIIGKNESYPFQHNVTISLEGDQYTPGIMLPGGTNLGAKALGECIYRNAKLS